MFTRLINLPKQHSFLLFGARGVGKTKYLEAVFNSSNSIWVDLLDPEQEARYIKRPNDFNALLADAEDNVSWIVIDEIQKAPALLNIIHKEVGKKRFHFALAGSSARKLKREKANMP